MGAESLQCQLPGCNQALPKRDGSAGRPRLYCCTSHRVRAWQLRNVELRGAEVALQLTKDSHDAAESASVNSRVAYERLAKVEELVNELTNIVTEFDKLTAPMVERTRNARLSMRDLSPEDRNRELRTFDEVGRVRDRLRTQIQELRNELGKSCPTQVA